MVMQYLPLMDHTLYWAPGVVSGLYLPFPWEAGMPLLCDVLCYVSLGDYWSKHMGLVPWPLSGIIGMSATGWGAGSGTVWYMITLSHYNISQILPKFPPKNSKLKSHRSCTQGRYGVSFLFNAWFFLILRPYALTMLMIIPPSLAALLLKHMHFLDGISWLYTKKNQLLNLRAEVFQYRDLVLPVKEF